MHNKILANLQTIHVKNNILGRFFQCLQIIKSTGNNYGHSGMYTIYKLDSAFSGCQHTYPEDAVTFQLAPV